MLKGDPILEFINAFYKNYIIIPPLEVGKRRCDPTDRQPFSNYIILFLVYQRKPKSQLLKNP